MSAIYPQTVGEQRSEAVATPLSGADIVSKGIADLERGVESIESLVVSIGAPRLAPLGFSVPTPIASPEHRLYEFLSAEEPDTAHSR